MEMMFAFDKLHGTRIKVFPLEKLIAYQREFLALKERLRVAEHRISQRSSELNTIVQQFRRAGAETNGSKTALSTISGTLKGVRVHRFVWNRTCEVCE